MRNHGAACPVVNSSTALAISERCPNRGRAHCECAHLSGSTSRAAGGSENRSDNASAIRSRQGRNRTEIAGGRQRREAINLAENTGDSPARLRRRDLYPVGGNSLLCV